MNSKKKSKKTNNQGFIVREERCYWFWTFEAALPAAIFLFWFINRDPELLTRSTGAYVNYLKARHWIKVIIVFDLYVFFSKAFKKIILQINDNGVHFSKYIHFSKDDYFYEYEWDEIEYIYEEASVFPRFFIKVFDKEEPYHIFMLEYMWTILPIRRAVKRYSKGQVKYYKVQEWKRMKKHADWPRSK